MDELSSPSGLTQIHAKPFALYVLTNSPNASTSRRDSIWFFSLTKPLAFMSRTLPSKETVDAILARANAEPGDILLFAADKNDVVFKTLGALAVYDKVVRRRTYARGVALQKLQVALVRHGKRVVLRHETLFLT